MKGHDAQRQPPCGGSEHQPRSAARHHDLQPPGHTGSRGAGHLDRYRSNCEDRNDERNDGHPATQHRHDVGWRGHRQDEGSDKDEQAGRGTGVAGHLSDVVAAAIPDAVIRPPLDYAEDEENLFNGIRYGCRLIALFVAIAEAAGADLTQESFQAGAESLTDFSFPGSPSASLSADKLFADDLFSLAEYDSTAGDGQAVPLGDLVDIFS